MLLIGVTLKAQTQTVYLSPDDKPLTERQFRYIMETQNPLVVKNDSLEIYKAITNRNVRGNIRNFDTIFNALKAIHPNLESGKPLLIIFYPGIDPCNSTGSATKHSRKKWFGELEKKVYEMAKVKPLYLYRRNEGLEKYGLLNWKKDPANIIEKTFFKFHYPCSSYVIVLPTGEYISFFGEFAKEGVWMNLKNLME